MPKNRKNPLFLAMLHNTPILQTTLPRPDIDSILIQPAKCIDQSDLLDGVARRRKQPGVEKHDRQALSPRDRHIQTLLAEQKVHAARKLFCTR